MSPFVILPGFEALLTSSLVRSVDFIQVSLSDGEYTLSVADFDATFRRNTFFPVDSFPRKFHSPRLFATLSLWLLCSTLRPYNLLC